MKKIDKVRWFLPFVVSGLYFLVVKKLMASFNVPLDNVDLFFGGCLWLGLSVVSLLVLEHGLDLFSKKYNNDKEDD